MSDVVTKNSGSRCNQGDVVFIFSRSARTDHSNCTKGRRLLLQWPDDDQYVDLTIPPQLKTGTRVGRMER
jgi:hypothetical protein